MKSNKAITQQLSNIEEALMYFTELRDKKQESFDNKSEKWQESDKGDEASNDISSLNSVVSDLETAKDSIESTFEME